MKNIIGSMVFFIFTAVLVYAQVGGGDITLKNTGGDVVFSHETPVSPTNNQLKGEKTMKTVTTAIITTFVAALLASTAMARPWNWSGNQRNTPGWQLMTPEERAVHQTKLRSFTDYNACKEYADQHHKLMEKRSKEKGVPLRAIKRNPCDMMKERGVFK